MELNKERIKALNDVLNFNFDKFKTSSFYKENQKLINELIKAVSQSEKLITFDKLNILEKEMFLKQIIIIEEKES